MHVLGIQLVFSQLKISSRGVDPSPLQRGWSVSPPPEGLIHLPSMEGLIHLPSSRGVDPSPLLQRGWSISPPEGLIRLPSSRGVDPSPLLQRGWSVSPPPEGLISLPSSRGVDPSPLSTTGNWMKQKSSKDQSISYWNTPWLPSSSSHGLSPAARTPATAGGLSWPEHDALRSDKRKRRRRRRRRRRSYIWLQALCFEFLRRGIKRLRERK